MCLHTTYSLPIFIPLYLCWTRSLLCWIWPLPYFQHLYPAKVVSKFTIIFDFCLVKGISCQCNFSHEFLYICIVFTNSCINYSKFSSWGPLIHQINDAIIMVNTEFKRRLKNPKIQVFKYILFLKFNPKCFFRHLSKFIKCCLFISSIHNIISRNCNIVNNFIREYLNLYIVINGSFLIYHNCNNCIN